MAIAIIMLLGPGEIELNRFQDLLVSIIKYEEEHLDEIDYVVVNDGNKGVESLTGLLGKFKSFSIIDNPLYLKTDQLFDRHTAGVLGGIKHAIKHLQPEYLIKLDTDVLCINPFFEKLRQHFDSNKEIGLVGTYLNWPDGGSRLRDFDDWGLRIRKVHAKPLIKNILIGLLSLNLNHVKRHFLRKSIFKKALKNGYKYGYHIQGGAYAISGLLLEYFAENQTLDDPLVFERSYIGEDSIVALIVASTGYQLSSYNSKGEVFGVWFRQPAFSAAQLKEFGYSLVHSIKSPIPEEEKALRASYVELSSKLI